MQSGVAHLQKGYLWVFFGRKATPKILEGRRYTKNLTIMLNKLALSIVGLGVVVLGLWGFVEILILMVDMVFRRG